MKRTAWITLRHQPPYRSDAFAEGLESLGFVAKLQFPEPGEVKPQDVVVTWNLNPRYRAPAHEAKRVGAALLVSENGYVFRKGSQEHYYALARDGHNGSGYWYVGPEDRFTPLGRPLAPWQPTPGGHVLIADQRGIGSEIMRCPRGLYEHVVPKLKRLYARVDKKAIPEFRLRAHPGRHAPARSLEEDLKGAQAVVTWASNVANTALLHGIPAFRLAPYHVNDAACPDISKITAPDRPDREAAFRRVAWAQWALHEISEGRAFKHLLADVL